MQLHHRSQGSCIWEMMHVAMGVQLAYLYHQACHPCVQSIGKPAPRTPACNRSACNRSRSQPSAPFKADSSAYRRVSRSLCTKVQRCRRKIQPLVEAATNNLHGKVLFVQSRQDFRKPAMLSAVARTRHALATLLIETAAALTDVCRMERSVNSQAKRANQPAMLTEMLSKSEAIRGAHAWWCYACVRACMCACVHACSAFKGGPQGAQMAGSTQC